MSEDDDDVQDPFVEDSDEDSEDDDREQGSPRAHTPADSSQRDYVGSVEYNPHEEEEAEQAESRDDEVDGDAMSDDEAEDTGAGAVTGPAESSSVDTQYTEVQARQYKPETVSRTRIDSPYSDAEMLTPQSATDAGRHDSGLRVSSPAAQSMEASSQHYHLRTPSPKPLPGTSRTKRDRVRAVDGGAAVNSDVPRSAPKGSQAAHREPDRRKRRKVNVLDSAYPTFKALLFFLYTDTVEFAPLTSSFLPIDMAAADDLNESTSAGLMDSASRRTRGDALGNIAEEVAKAHRKRKAVINAYCERNPDKPSPCSAKAMYRLADKLDVPDLKRRAQEHIAMSLTVHNIVWEVFSGFNTQYPDIRKMETDFLLKHWPQVKRSNAMKSIFLRSSAHPGLAEVWPHLLEYLEYRQPEVDDAEETPC